jgi:hypothetical protein
MAVDISDAFIQQFESEVHVAYQRMGSKLRNTVRTKNGIAGYRTTFQKYGTGIATTKSRHGNVVPMNIDHSTVTCDLADYYAAEYIDKLDELKINIDERQLAAQAGANALGRKTDELLITALDTSTNLTTEGGTTRLTTTKIRTVFVYFNENEVPDDGQRMWVISPDQWLDLLDIDAFAKSDYIGYDQLPYKAGMTAKSWMSFMWFQHSGLTETSNIRKTFAWHKNAMGHAIGADVSSEINYIPEKVSHLATSMMSQGACLIDAIGVYEVQAYAA